MRTHVPSKRIKAAHRRLTERDAKGRYTVPLKVFAKDHEDNAAWRKNKKEAR